MARELSIVLDTCALIWWSLDPEKLSQTAIQACEVMEQLPSRLQQTRHQRH